MGVLRQKGGEAAGLRRLLGEDLEVLVNDANGHEDTGARANGAHEVSKDGEETNAETTKGRGSGNVAVELLEHRVLAVTADDHLLILELLGHVAGGAARDLDPGAREEGATILGK